jgi:hypothetical protein
MPQQAAYLDDNGNPIYLDDNGNVIKSGKAIPTPAPTPTPTPVTKSVSESPEEGFLTRAYKTIFETPEFITKGAQNISRGLTEHSLDESMLGSMARGFLGGATEGAASLLTPANILTLGRGRLASVAAKALGIVQAAHGVGDIAEGDLPQGAVDIALGGLNMLTGGKSPLRGRLDTIIKDSEAMRRSPLSIPKAPATDIIASQPIRPAQRMKSETGAINIEPAPEGARNIKLKQPTMELIHALGKRGYVPGGVGPDGIPFMTYKGKPIPLEDLPIAPEQKASVMQELYNLPRGLTTSWDISAPLRQGLPLITKKEWWKAWPSMIKSMKSEQAYDMVMANIEARPFFASTFEPAFVGGKWVNKRVPSLAEKSGLKMTDLKSFSSREENLMSSWAEYAPGVKRSNRAYTAFLNKLRADTFESLIKDADAINNPVLAKEIADFVNTATGRGPLRTHLPNISRGGVGLKERSLEQAASVLTNTLFSPRLVASRVRMLNPATYIAASPFVRRQYMKAFLSTAGAWGTVASLAKMAGADVVLDPNNSDFGKIKIGNTRLDPAAGFQQYLVLAHRLLSGKTTSSTSGRTQELGKGFRAPTRRSVAEDFGANKLHPTLKFAYDLYDASQYKSVMLGDRVAQMFVPLIVQDVMELAKEDLSLLPLVIPTAMGMGTQTYEKGRQESVLLPEEYDVKYQGGGF